MKIRLYIAHALMVNLPNSYFEQIVKLKEELSKNPDVEILEPITLNINYCDVMIAESSFHCLALSMQINKMTRTRKRTLWRFSEEESEGRPLFTGGPGSVLSPLLRYDTYPKGELLSIVPIINQRLKEMMHTPLSQAIMMPDAGSQT